MKSNALIAVLAIALAAGGHAYAQKKTTAPVLTPQDYLEIQQLVARAIASTAIRALGFMVSPSSFVASAFRRTFAVRLKPDATDPDCAAGPSPARPAA